MKKLPLFWLGFIRPYSHPRVPTLFVHVRRITGIDTSSAWRPRLLIGGEWLEVDHPAAEVVAAIEKMRQQWRATRSS